MMVISALFLFVGPFFNHLGVQARFKCIGALLDGSLSPWSTHLHVRSLVLNR